MKRFVLWAVVPVLIAFGAVMFGTFLLNANTQLPSTVGVLLHDDQTGEKVEFGTAMNTVGQILEGSNVWNSNAGERIEETCKFLPGHQFALVHLVVTKANISRSFYRIVPVRNERPELWEGEEYWVIGDHFRVGAFVGGFVVTA